MNNNLIIWWKATKSGSKSKAIAITATSYIPPGQKDKIKLKKLLSTKKVAMNAAPKPSRTKSIVATNPWKELLATSLKVLLANLHPTDAPKINKQKLIEKSGNL